MTTQTISTLSPSVAKPHIAIGPTVYSTRRSPKPSSKRSPMVLHARVVSGTGGGPDKTILNSPRELRNLGYESACLYLRDPQDEGFKILQQRANQRDANVIGVDDFGVLDWKIVERVSEKVSELKPDVWHGHDYKSNLLGLLLRRKHPMKLVTTVHGWVQKTWKTPLYYAIDRRCLPRYDEVICVSKDLFDDCRKLGVASEKLSLIDNAIVLEDYDSTIESQQAKLKLGMPPNVPMIAGVGRLSAEKGFNLLIEAVAKLSETGQTISLAIAGDGAEYHALKELIKQKNLQRNVKLLGFVEDARLVYQAADLFVLSSHREGLPNVVLEAMASGTPVLATKIAGMPTLINDGINGKLIEPGSVDQLVTGIDELVSKPSDMEKFVINARQTLLDRFDFRSRMKKVVAVYQRLDRVTSKPVDSISDSLTDGLAQDQPQQETQFQTMKWNGEFPLSVDSGSFKNQATHWPQLLGHQSAWMRAITKGFGHDGYLIQARSNNKVVGVLPLCLVSGPIFGKFLVSLPYINTGGVWANDQLVAKGLIDSACKLADQLNVKHLELRQEFPVEHDQLSVQRTDKFHLRLPLPPTSEEMLAKLKSKVRSQVKKSWTGGLEIRFGGQELLNDFHHVFATNMRDLGTPVFSRKLFTEIINAFHGDAELGVVYSGSQAVAGALLVHGNNVTEVPSASCLRAFNGMNANMFMYWQLLDRAISRGSQVFDFGRSSKESGTYRFKRQWGAEPSQACWQYYVRRGNPADLRVDAGNKQGLVRAWKRLPVWLTKLAGPTIVRGIP